MLRPLSLAKLAKCLEHFSSVMARVLVVLQGARFWPRRLVVALNCEGVSVYSGWHPVAGFTLGELTCRKLAGRAMETVEMQRNLAQQQVSPLMLQVHAGQNRCLGQEVSTKVIWFGLTSLLFKIL